MRRIHLLIAALLIPASIAAPAVAGIIDTPLPILPNTVTQSQLAYIVTGVVDNNASIATAVFCTNLDTVDGEIAVQVFNWNDAPLNDVTVNTNGSYPFLSGNTVTIVTSSVASLNEDETLTLAGGYADTGAARILSTVKKLVCTAQVIDRINTPPTSAVQLPVFRKGKQKGD